MIYLSLWQMGEFLYICFARICNKDRLCYVGMDPLRNGNRLQHGCPKFAILIPSKIYLKELREISMYYSQNN
jgi:hypothetical protein